MDIRPPSNRRDAGWFCIFYGHTDVGKTHLLGTAQDCEATSPTLFIDIDQGDLTLSERSDLDVVTVKNFDELQDIYEFLLEDNDKYRSVCLDSLTAEQADISMPTILEELDDGKIADLGRVSHATQRDWGSSAHQMRKTLMAFKQLSRHPDPDKRLHVFMTALERVDEKRDIGVPALPGSLGFGCGSFVDVLARLTVDEEDVRRMFTTKHVDDTDGIVYLGKNRLRLLPRRMKNPSINRIMSRLTAE